jgi:hypothetical protein
MIRILKNSLRRDKKKKKKKENQLGSEAALGNSSTGMMLRCYWFSLSLSSHLQITISMQL